MPGRRPPLPWRRAVAALRGAAAGVLLAAIGVTVGAGGLGSAALAQGTVQFPPAPSGAPQSGFAQSGIVQSPAQSAVMRPVIGIMDLQFVLSESQAARQVLRQRERYMETYQAEAAAVEKELRAIDQDLAQMRSTASPEEMARKQREFQTRVATFQQEVQTRRRNLERAFAEAMNDVQSVVVRVADAIASERGMNLVLHRSQVFLFDPQLDLTDAVLARVDAELPTASMADPDSLPPLDEAPSGVSPFFRPQ